MSPTIPFRRPLPRNLTARAAHIVEGNPMITRPESGVGNAHPGLEFDVRVLDRYFLPGLVFNFQYGAGAKLFAKTDENPNMPVLTPDDLKQGLFLLLLKARFGKNPGQDECVTLANVDGYLVLRKVIDLEPGQRTVMVGPLATSQSDRFAELKIALETGGAIPAIQRDDNGKLVYAIVSGTRDRFLTADGVIDPDLIAPGELTQNLCSPWQWDFADCYCYYWASSKPDIVVGITGEAQVLNFQRDRSASEPAKPASTPKEWMAGNMSEADLILNWEKLPIVTSEREGVVPRKPEWPYVDPAKILTLDQIADALPDLAALEHALCVEYLFAKFTIAAPVTPPSHWRRTALRRFQAQQEIFSIAIDEMRHFRWVNEMLRLLERPPAMGRAEVIGRDLRRTYSLRSLTPDVLDQFIAIEAPGSIYNDDPQQLDSMYTQILVSLHHIAMPKQEDLRLRLKQLVKTIIDEGEDHWDRFLRVKKQLAGQKPSTYLREIAPIGIDQPPPWGLVQKLCDSYYKLLLQCLFITFMLGRSSRGHWLSLSHCAMFALDSTATFLAQNGFGPKFTKVDWPRGFPFAPDNSKVTYTRQLREVIESTGDIEEMFRCSFETLDELRGVSRFRDFVTEQSKKLNRMKQAMQAAFNEASVAAR